MDLSKISISRANFTTAVQILTSRWQNDAGNWMKIQENSHMERHWRRNED